MAEQVKKGIPVGKTSLAISMFGGRGERLNKNSYQPKSDLLKSHTPMTPSVYAAYAIMVTITLPIVWLIVGFVVLVLLLPSMDGQTIGVDEEGNFIKREIADWVWYLSGFLFFIALPVLSGLFMAKLPSFKIKAAIPAIDRKLPYASSFVAAMAAANATPVNIFKALAVQREIYGSISDEAALIYRDVTYLGKDLVSSLKMSVERAPSEKLAEFFQGIVGTLTSGGNLKLYFLNRAEYYAQENRIRVRQVIEKLALFAESYVVSAVAMPIFIMIIMVITMWVSGSGFNMDRPMMNLIVFAMLPFTQFGYAALFYLFSQDVA